MAEKISDKMLRLSGDHILYVGREQLREWAAYIIALETNTFRFTSGLRLLCRRYARELSECWSEQSGEPALTEGSPELDRAAGDVMREVMLEVDGKKESAEDAR